MFGILASLAGGLLGASASRRAADQQAQAAREQLDFSKQVYQDQQNAFAPYVQAGQQGMQAYNSLLGLGSAPEGFGGYQQSPGYQFQLSQGLDAAKSAAMGRGGMGSGSTMTALNNYAQGVANQDYQTYLNRLQGVAQMGQASAGGVASAAGQYGANGLSAIGSRGDAQAAGTMGGYNALANGINGAISSYGYMQGAGQQGGGFGGFANSLSGLFGVNKPTIGV